NFALGLIAATTVDVGHDDEINVGKLSDLIQKIVAPIADANHADSDAIVCAQHPGGGIGEHGRCAQSCLLKKSTSCLMFHEFSPTPRPMGPGQRGSCCFQSLQ